MAGKKKVRQADDASPADVIIDLETTLGIADAARFYQKLAAALEEKREVVFDASRVEMAGTAMLQMLVAFMQAMRDAGVAVHWKSPSEALRKTAALLDLEGHLGLVSSDNDGSPAWVHPR
jgi:anti-anti-sigma regulatory factor